MTIVTRKAERLQSLRPLLYGIPTFIVIFAFLLWSLARLASWIIALLKVTK